MCSHRAPRRTRVQLIFRPPHGTAWGQGVNPRVGGGSPVGANRRADLKDTRGFAQDERRRALMRAPPAVVWWGGARPHLAVRRSPLARARKTGPVNGVDYQQLPAARQRRKARAKRLELNGSDRAPFRLWRAFGLFARGEYRGMVVEFLMLRGSSRPFPSAPHYSISWQSRVPNSCHHKVW